MFLPGGSRATSTPLYAARDSPSTVRRSGRSCRCLARTSGRRLPSAPPSSRTRAQASSVAPVVITSSMRRTLPRTGFEPSVKAPVDVLEARRGGRAGGPAAFRAWRRFRAFVSRGSLREAGQFSREQLGLVVASEAAAVTGQRDGDHAVDGGRPFREQLRHETGHRRRETGDAAVLQGVDGVARGGVVGEDGASSEIAGRVWAQSSIAYHGGWASSRWSSGAALPGSPARRSRRRGTRRRRGRRRSGGGRRCRGFASQRVAASGFSARVIWPQMSG